MWEPCEFSCLTFIVIVVAMEISRKRMQEISDRINYRRQSVSSDKRHMKDITYELMEQIKEIHGRVCALEERKKQR